MEFITADKRRHDILDYLQKKQIPFQVEDIDIPPFKNEVTFGTLTLKQKNELEDFIRQLHVGGLYDWVC